MTLPLHSNYVKFFPYLLNDYLYYYYAIKYIYCFNCLEGELQTQRAFTPKSSLCMKNKNIFLHYSKNIKIKKLTLTKCSFVISSIDLIQNFPVVLIKLSLQQKRQKKFWFKIYLGSDITFSYLVSLAFSNLEQFLTLSSSFMTLPLLQNVLSVWVFPGFPIIS